jgi:hypothetical protein
MLGHAQLSLYIPHSRLLFTTKKLGSWNIRAASDARAKPVEVESSLSGELTKEFEIHADLGALKSPCQVTGKSGVRHKFTFGFEVGPSVNVVGDVVMDTAPVDETKVLSLFIKVYDVGAKHAVLCVVPSLTPEAKKLSNLYRILTVESEDKGRLTSMASETLHRLSTSN